MNIKILGRKSALKMIAVFFVGSLCTGFIFGYITRIPNQAEFWFTKGDKFYVPTLNYWIGASISLFVGLMCSYIYIRIKNLLPYCSEMSLIQHILSALFILAAYPAMEFTDRFFWMHLDWDFVRSIYIFIGPTIVALFVSLSLYVLTRKWELPISLLILAACFLVGIFSSLIISIFDLPGRQYELVQFPSNHSLLAVLYGLWLIRASKSANTDL